MKKLLSLILLLFLFTTTLNGSYLGNKVKKGVLAKTTSSIIKNKTTQKAVKNILAKKVKDKVSKIDIEPTYKTLRKEKKKDAHHIIQDASVKDIKGYSRNEAPAIQLDGSSSEIGTEHYKATQEQRKSGGGTYAKERVIAYKSLRKADIPKEEAKKAIKRADTYFENIGVKLDTETRIPQNRKKQ